MKTRRSVFILSVFLLATFHPALGQPSIFSIMQDREKQGDEFFAEGNFTAATESYEALREDDPGNAGVQLKLARTYYNLKDYKQAIKAFEAASSTNTMQSRDMLMMAESYMAVRKYDQAKRYLKAYTEKVPSDNLAARKLWQLDNLQFLYEDSSHFSVRPISGLNTRADDLCAVALGNEVVFTSNRKGIRPVDQTSAQVNAPHFTMYTASRKTGTSTISTLSVSKPQRFAPSLKARFNAGPVAFFKNGSRMVFVASAPKPASDGFRSLGLYFASRQGDTWKLDHAYQYNSDEYLIADVTINEQGTVMWFSSDMKGGKGRKDLYRSEYMNGIWMKPVNAGAPINTEGDEAFPYLFREGTLYFASNGHPGLGGLDIYKTAILKDGYSEPENMGYPVNTHGDDFGISFDGTGTGGYFTSNRKGSGDDDVYEFSMDMQPYPLTISGTLKYKENMESNSADIETWPDVMLTLVDTWQNTNIAETKTSTDGTFTFTIPYYSRYHILVTTKDKGVYMAGLELQKYQAAATDYEIVVIKDSFIHPEEPRKDE